jgi:hypothetical protein
VEVGAQARAAGAGASAALRAARHLAAEEAASPQPEATAASSKADLEEGFPQAGWVVL